MEDHQEEKPTLAIFEFKWELTNVPKEAVVILTKMIEFRGEKSFRAGLKKHESDYESSYSHTRASSSSSTLLFMTTDLAKLGLIAETVLYTIDGGRSTEKMRFVTSNDPNDNFNGKIQLFKANLGNTKAGKQSYKFLVYISGVVENYQFRQRDSLINQQLWLSAQNQVETDFEIIVGKKIFTVHKFILAARSPVFEAYFNNERNIESDQERELMDFDDDFCMEQFLKFIYTGELEGVIQNPDKLKQLATFYEIKTLETICEAALQEIIDEDQMIKFVLQFETTLAGSCSIEIMPDTDSTMHYSSNVAVLNYVWRWTNWKPWHLIMSKDAFEYKNEKIFRTQLKTRSSGSGRNSNTKYVFTLTLICHRNQESGCVINQMASSIHNKHLDYDWVPIKRKCLQMGYFEETEYEKEDPPSCVIFHIKVANKIQTYDFRFVDSTWGEQIWSAAIAKKFTDVEFLIGDQSVAAHRFILSVRSPVFAAMFNSGMAETQTGQVRIDDDVDPNIFRAFLEFLYVGDLKSFKGKEQLFALADKYQVETLMALCKPTTEQPMDIDDFTKALLVY